MFRISRNTYRAPTVYGVLRNTTYDLLIFSSEGIVHVHDSRTHVIDLVHTSTTVVVCIRCTTYYVTQYPNILNRTGIHR